MKLMVIGNVGFDLMAPYLKKFQIGTVLVSPTKENFHAHLADKTYLYCSEDDWLPLLKLALKERVNGVISIAGPDRINVRDSYLKAVLEKDYGIPVLANPLPAVKIAADKSKTKQWLRENGFPAPEGKLAKSASDALAFADLVGFPLVLKLTDHAGGQGMRIIKYRRLLRKIPDNGYPLLAEEYVHGSEYSVEVLNNDQGSLAMPPVFKGCTSPQGIHPMERVKLAPAPLSPVEIAQLRRLAKKVVTSLNLQPTADVDIVWGNRGPQILEINPRFGGVTALSMAASGILSYQAIVDMILNRWQPYAYNFNRCFAADLPIIPNIGDHLVKRLLLIDGVFRVKIQKLKKTHGRIALKAGDKETLLQIAKKVAFLCRSQVCLNQLEQLLI